MEIIVEGRIYQVERDDNAPHGPAYILNGPRGARYKTLRSIRRPPMLYLFNMRDWRKGAPKCWLTDKDGELRVVR